MITNEYNKINKKQKSRPLSSNLGYIRKQSNNKLGVNSNRLGYNKNNEVFDMIKMGNYEQNLFLLDQNN